MRTCQLRTAWGRVGELVVCGGQPLESEKKALVFVEEGEVVEVVEVVEEEEVLEGGGEKQEVEDDENDVL